MIAEINILMGMLDLAEGKHSLFLHIIDRINEQLDGYDSS